MIKIVALGLLFVLAVALIAGLVFEQISERRTIRRFPSPGRLVDVGGHSLHMRCQGRGDGPTIFIEQGAGSLSVFWWPAQRDLAEAARVCTYDRPGYLWSPSLGLGRSITARVDDLRKLLVNSGERGPFVLVAHSYGGLLVGQLARRYPELVAGIVFVDAPDERVIYGGKYLEQSKSMMRIVGMLAVVARFGVLRLVNPMLAGLPAHFSDEEIATLKAFASRPDFLAAMVDDFDSMNSASGEERSPAPPGSLGAIPVSVVSHGIPFPPPYDALNEGWEEGQARLAALTSNGEVVMASKSSHMIQFDEPEVVIDSIRRVHAAARDGTRLAQR
jgi:pimeloyl-ACP methyl ester carboxylesterase